MTSIETGVKHDIGQSKIVDSWNFLGQEGKLVIVDGEVDVDLLMREPGNKDGELEEVKVTASGLLTYPRDHFQLAGDKGVESTAPLEIVGVATKRVEERLLSLVKVSNGLLTGRENYLKILMRPAYHYGRRGDRDYDEACRNIEKKRRFERKVIIGALALLPGNLLSSAIENGILVYSASGDFLPFMGLPRDVYGSYEYIFPVAVTDEQVGWDEWDNTASNALKRLRSGYWKPVAVGAYTGNIDEEGT